MKVDETKEAEKKRREEKGREEKEKEKEKGTSATLHCSRSTWLLLWRFGNW
jgi:hypothetical protein